jgi:excisionase family DNA binding protein
LYNNNDDSHEVGSGSSRRGSRRCRELQVDALSPEEWNYLRGLFLADGYSVAMHGRFRGYVVYFYLQGNEEELALRVAGWLRRAGLNPRLWRQRRRKDMVAVVTSSKSLLGFLPDKKALLRDAMARRRFFDENRLLSAEGGVPFIAGLLDGDGHCGVTIMNGRGCFGRWVSKYKWSFTQRRYMFLAEYVSKFVESLVQGGAHIFIVPNGAAEVDIHKSGTKALLEAGIARYSWKVVQWQRSIADVESERVKHCNVGEAARIIGVSKQVVRRWLKSGEMKHVRNEGKIWRRSPPSIPYIPMEEVERFKEEVQLQRAEMEKAKREGVRLREAERILGVSYWTLRRAYKRGELRATLVREYRGQWYWVIPRGDVKRVKHVRRRRGEC